MIKNIAENHIPFFVGGLVFIGCILFIVLASYSPFFDYSYNGQRVYEILLLAFLSVAFLFWKNWRFGFSDRIIFGILGLFIFGLVSAASSNLPMQAFLEVGIFILLFSSFSFLVQLYIEYDKPFQKIILITLAITALLYLANVTYSYIQSFFIEGFPVWPSTKFLQWYSNGEPLFPEPFLGFIHVRYLNHLHTWSLPLFALMVVKIPKKDWAVKWCVFALSCLWWMLVFAADARGTMLASFLSFMCVAYLFRKKIIEWLKVYAGGAAFGFILYLLVFKLFQGGGRTVFSRSTDSGRFEMWEYALQLILENPLFGIGPMHYAEFANGIRFAAPHNIYLQIASEWGFVAFIIVAVICVSAYITWIKFCKEKLNDSEENIQNLNVLAALTASITAAAIHGFFTNLINPPLSQLMMIVVLGWSFGLYQKEKNIEPREIKESILKWSIPLFKTLILITVLYVAGMTYYSYQHLDESRKLFIEQTERSLLYPRFWDHGIIGVEKK